MLTKEFVLAGRAIFTVQSKTGQYYTFRVTRKEAEGQWADCWFISLLTGPDNTSSYTYLGILEADTGYVRLTKKSPYDADSTPVRVIRWALSLLWRDAAVPEGYHIHHEGKCGRCGRTLTVPSSIESGIGPECAKALA